jgi:hypothetical protein
MRRKGKHMGQCGCGDTSIDKGYVFPNGTVVAYDIYRGCRDCNPGPGISIYAYPSRRAGRMWLSGVEIEKYKPDEYGGNGGYGISFGLFEVEDLIAEAKELVAVESGEIDPDGDGYATIQDWLHDYGLLMVQGAMRRYCKRIEPASDGEPGEGR